MINAYLQIWLCVICGGGFVVSEKKPPDRSDDNKN